MSIHCRICSHSNLEHLFKSNGYDIIKCNLCGVAQTSEIPSAEQLMSIYSNRYFEHKKYRLDQSASREMKRRMSLLNHIGVAQGSQVLDAGCATGDYLWVAKKSYEMYGVDVSESAIGIARDRNPEIDHRIFASEICDLEIEKKSLDAVVLWDVLEHATDPADLLRFLALLLKPGGRLCFSTPNMGSAMARFAGKRWAFMTPPEHQFFFTSNGISHLLRECGFTKIYEKSLGKWTTLGFILYKLGRVIKEIPKPILDVAKESHLGNIPIYVPSKDIMYVGAVKNE